MCVFANEKNRLANGKVVDKQSKLHQLTPILDEQLVIRIGGRIENAADTEYDVKNPIILNGKCPYTNLLIRHYHEQANHFGHNTVLNELRQRYHIIGAKVTLRKISFQCVKCKIMRGKPGSTIMGQLPDYRLAGKCPAFTYTGVDYFGPMLVKVGRRLQKRYGVLFTCMVYRAVHIEIAYSLTTDSCIMALRKFIARRGCPQKMFSDNGTNLKGADMELKKSLAELDENKIRAAMTNHRIKWQIHPASCTAYGWCLGNISEVNQDWLKFNAEDCSSHR